MKVWRTAALAAALLAAAATGAAFLPPAHAQAPARAARAIAISGRGSQIGITIRDAEEADAKATKMPTPSGVVIEEVREDSPAAKAGLKKGDVIVEFDGERVRGVRQFTRLVQETPSGRRTQAAVMRDGQKVNVTVEPRESDGFNVFADGTNLSVLRDFSNDFAFDMPRPAAPAPPVPPKPPVPPLQDFDTFVWRSGNTLGVTVGDLSEQLAQYFGTKDGVLVTSVTDNSAASKAGIKAGDVIMSFNGSDVTTSSDLRRRIQRLQDGDEFTIGIMRDKKALTLKGKAETTRPKPTHRSIV